MGLASSVLPRFGCRWRPERLSCSRSDGRLRGNLLRRRASGYDHESVSGGGSVVGVDGAVGAGRKFAQYRRVASLREYVPVSQDAMQVEWFTRGEDGEWTYREAVGPDGIVRLEGLGVTLGLGRGYRVGGVSIFGGMRRERRFEGWNSKGRLPRRGDPGLQFRPVAH